MRSFFSLFFVSFLLFLSACGLEEVISIEAPTVTNNNPLYSSDDYTTWYFSFVTRESGQPDSFIGTQVYYKIYNNVSKLGSDRSSITTVNYAENGTASATRMIETLSFQPLGTSVPTGNSVFVENAGSNRSVILRLKDYANRSAEYSGTDRHIQDACVGIRSGTEYVYETYIPYRNGNSKSFDFFDEDDDDDSNERDVEPVEGDSDYYHSSSATEADTYYVQLFAVGTAWNVSTCSPVYSLVLDLGSVRIKKGE